MAVRFDAAADRLLRTTDLLDYNAVYTWMAWVYLVSDLNAAGRFWSLNTNSTTNDFDFVGVTTDGTTLIARTAVGAATTTGTGTNLSIQTWYHVALVRSATNTLDVYLNGVSDSTHTRSTTGRTAVTRMEAGAWTSGNANRTDCRIMGMKAYTTNLSAAEIANEMNTIRPQRTDNLYAWWPIFNGDRTTDYNGNARPWTEGGTLTDEDPPPVSYGARIYFIPYVPSLINGVGAYTQDNDTVSATGTVDIAGVSSYTQADDTVAATATADIAGVSAYTQADDTVVATGTVDIAGVANYTQADDSVAASGTVDIAAQSAYTQADDTLASAGTVAITGSAAYTQADDTAGGAGTGDIAGTASITQDNDTVIAVGTVAIVGTAAYTQANDTLVATGTAGTVTFVNAGYTIVAEARNTQVVAAPRITTIEADERNTAIIADARQTIVVADPRNTRITG